MLSHCPSLLATHHDRLSSRQAKSILETHSGSDNYNLALPLLISEYKVFLVIIFWIWRLVYGSPNAPRFLWLRRANRHLREWDIYMFIVSNYILPLERFSPWQIIVSTLTAVYAARNLDKITGFGGKSMERYQPLIHLIWD